MNDFRTKDQNYRSEEENRVHSDRVEREEGIFGHNDIHSGDANRAERKMEKAEKKMEKAHDARTDAAAERAKGNYDTAERKEDKAERKIEKAEKKVHQAYDSAKEAGKDILRDLDDSGHDHTGYTGH